MAIRPRMTQSNLEGIRLNVRNNPLAGKGFLTLDQLENDAICAFYNSVVTADEAERIANQPVIELTKKQADG